MLLGLAGLGLGASPLRAGDPPPGYSDSEDESTHRWRSAWYAREAQRPVGTRQKKAFGKLWPPYPRPVGKEQQFSQRYHAAHYWPTPYNCEDRQYVRQLSDMQVDSGWATATTLFDYHFDDETQELNHAGRMHLRWILENAPVQRRLIHVQYGQTHEITELRLAGVRSEAVMMVGAGGVPPIMVRIASPYGRPADEIRAIRAAEAGSMPEPRIQYSTGSGSNSSQQQSGM